METINLLDLNNDILNIIGDYVIQDNIKREYIVVHEIGKNSINLFKIIKKSKWNDNKPAMRRFIVNYFNYSTTIQPLGKLNISALSKSIAKPPSNTNNPTLQRCNTE